MTQYWRSLLSTDNDVESFTFTATGTLYSSWVNISSYNELISFLEATYTNQSGATLDVSIEIYNPLTGTAFTHTSHTQLTATGAEHKGMTVFAGQARVKLVAGGTFGASESIVATVDFYGKNT